MTETLIAAAAALAITGTLCFTVLRGWRGWLDVKRLEIAQRRSASDTAEDEVGVRIELAAVKERLKKLEAIASGVDL